MILDDVYVFITIGSAKGGSDVGGQYDVPCVIVIENSQKFSDGGVLRVRRWRTR